MIDTDKYEGHNTDDRIWHQYSEGLTSDYTDGRSRADEADARLVADAPLLLEHVKRLREDLERTRSWIQKQVEPLRKMAQQANYVALAAEKDVLDRYMGDD